MNNGKINIDLSLAEKYTDRNAPERDSHLYDTRKAFHSKDDAKQLLALLKKLKDAFPEYDTENKTHTSGKMRCTMHSGRRQKNGRVFSAKHNDRNFSSEPEHIIKEKSEDNLTWNWCGKDISFDEGELKFYEENFSKQLEYTNQKYINNRHKERVMTMDQWRKSKQHCPEETILQIGKINEHPDVELSKKCFDEYIDWLDNWNEDHNRPFELLNWALHQDEQGAPHFQLRKVWIYVDDETNLVTTGQEKALEMAGVSLPNPGQKTGRRNNRKITFDKMCRDKWIEIARKHGLEIESVPKPKEEVGFTLEEYQKRQDKIRRESFDYLIKFTEANINASEKIDSWESVMPEVEDFDSWIFRQCEMYRSETDAGKRKRIRDEIVGRFAGERKVLKEKKVDKSIER